MHNGKANTSDPLIGDAWPARVHNTREGATQVGQVQRVSSLWVFDSGFSLEVDLVFEEGRLFPGFINLLLY